MNFHKKLKKLFNKCLKNIKIRIMIMNNFRIRLPKVK